MSLVTLCSDTALVVSVDPLGAQLVRIRRETDGMEYLWVGDELHWKRHAPILFPFVARLAEGRYRYRGVSYEMPPHGFLSHEMFDIVRGDDGKSLVCTYRPSKAIKAIYPFRFAFRVIYTLVADTLMIEYHVSNLDDAVLHYGLGSHPGFSVPLNPNLAFEDYYIEFPQASDLKRRVFSSDCFDTGVEEPFSLPDHRVALRHELFNNDAVILKNTGSVAVLATQKEFHAVRMTYPDTPICGLWHPVATAAPFVCIEPWHSLPAKAGEIIDIETKEDFFHLPPQGQSTHRLWLDFL